MRVSVVIPCFNERATIGQIVRAIRAAPVPDLELIVVDDASTDGTAELLRTELAAVADKVLFHAVNRGKGGALITVRRRPPASRRLFLAHERSAAEESRGASFKVPHGIPRLRSG